GDVELAVGDPARDLYRLEVPGPFPPVPLVAGLYLEQLIAQAVTRLRDAVRSDDDDVEACVFAFTERAAGEQRLDADHGAGRRHRQREPALDGAAARFGEPHGQLRFKRLGCARLLVDREGELRLAVAVGGRQPVERLAALLDLLVVQPKVVARETRPFGGDADHDLALERKTRRRRAVEIAAVDRDLGGWRPRYALGGRRQVELEPVRHIVLDHEGRFADRRTLGIGERAHAPGPGRRGGDQRHVERVSADALVGDDDTAILDAIRTLDHQSQRHAERRNALRVAQQRREVDGLAGAIDAALGIDKGIEAGWHRAAGDAAVGEVEGRRL